MRTVQPALVWCPFPDRDTAKEISGVLLSERHIACANILGEVESIFNWNGQRSCETEMAVLFKTTNICVKAMITRLGELHPYDTPAIIGWDGGHALPATLDWLGQQCEPDKE